MGRISANRVAEYMIWLAEFKKNSKEVQEKKDKRNQDRDIVKKDEQRKDAR